MRKPGHAAAERGADDTQQPRAPVAGFVATRPRGGSPPRYLTLSAARFDNVPADPSRDQRRHREIRPLEQRYLRKLAERRGARDARLDEFRWWLEELRVGLFAQELKTPQPVSVKRLDKIWAQAFA